MQNQFTTYSTTSFGSRIISSVTGIVFGLILFIASFVLLYWNEGRFDTSLLAKTATDISSQQANTNSALDGKLISTTGTLTSTQTIGDNMFLNPGNYIAVNREGEMYAWTEQQNSSSNTNTGGSQNTQTTYTYKMQWMETPADSTAFKYPDGHTNPQKTISNDSNRVTSATIGSYSIDIADVDLPNFTKLPLSPEIIIPHQGVLLEDSNYLFTGNGNLTSPQVGDERISYTVVNNGINATVFGKLNGTVISPYYDAQNHRLFQIFSGTHDSAIATLHSEYTMWTWILRAVGFLMMWFGLMMLFGPISVILSFLPIFGSISKAFIAGVTLLVSIVLTIVTILVSLLLHNIFILLVAVILTLGVVFFVLSQKKKSGPMQATSQPLQPSTVPVVPNISTTPEDTSTT